MVRRDVLKLFAASFVARRLAAQQSDERPPLRYLTEAQHRLVDRLSEMIIPADEHSPGASAAGVADYVDHVLAEVGAADRAPWTAGFAALDAESRKRFGGAFMELAAADQDRLMARMAAGEAEPSDELEKFFVELKRLTAFGYYASAEGLHRDLQYQGIVPIAEYAACDHPEHGAD